ncbi:MAG: hypothetical protein ACREB9_01440, partial [Thermoplasmata archaeon]
SGFTNVQIDDNFVLCFAGTGGAANNSTYVKITPGANSADLMVRNNHFYGAEQGVGTIGFGYGIQIVGAGTFNELFIQNNYLGANWTNTIFIESASGATLTDTHSLMITGNFTQRGGQDSLLIEANGGSFGQVSVLGNQFTDYNWSNTASPAYAGVALNRTSTTGSIFGPVYINDNVYVVIDASQTITGVFIGSAGANVFQLCIGSRNYASLNTQAGTGTPTVESHSVRGTVFTIPGSVAAPSVPASGAATLNQVSADATLVVTGGTVTAIAVNGTSIGTTSGQVILKALDTYTLTYSTAPTLTYIIHGG